MCLFFAVFPQKCLRKIIDYKKLKWKEKLYEDIFLQKQLSINLQYLQ